jgi:anthranilate/para-aminobenzoate synthase component II
MIAVIDNGRGAEDIARLVRGAKVVKPSAAPKDANAYILSDGDLSKANQEANIKLIKANSKPILGIGMGQIYIGLAFGSQTKPSGCSKSSRVTVKQRSPILLDLKKQFAVNDGQKLSLASVSEEFGIVASCPKNEFEVIQHGANIDNPVEARPLFGVHFNPEAGLDGLQILRNFEQFVEMWAKYH